MTMLQMANPVGLRDGSSAFLLGRGVLGGVLVGRHDAQPITWHPSGRWRWDGAEDPRDIVEGLPDPLPRHTAVEMVPIFVIGTSMQPEAS